MNGMKSWYQEHYETEPFPDRPDGVSDRNWMVFQRHIQDDMTYVALGKEIGVVPQRIRTICESVWLAHRRQQRAVMQSICGTNPT